MDKTSKTILITAIVVSAVLFIGYCLACLNNIYQSSRWEVYEETKHNTDVSIVTDDVFDDYFVDYSPSTVQTYTAAGWKAEYAAVAIKPELSSCFELYAEKTINYHTKRIAVESYKYKSLNELCAALPSEWSDDIKAAVGSGDSFTTYDLKDDYVTVYTLSSGIELANLSDIGSQYRALAGRVSTKYYQIIEYDDGSYRFGFWFEY
jgi:hypothetical protein